MSLGTDDIQKLAELARLQIDDNETADVSAKLSDIVAFVDQLKAADTAGVRPMAHPLERTQRLREDLVTETDGRTLFQLNAPAVEQGLYLVPKVIE